MNIAFEFYTHFFLYRLQFNTRHRHLLLLLLHRAPSTSSAAFVHLIESQLISTCSDCKRHSESNHGQERPSDSQNPTRNPEKRKYRTKVYNFISFYRFGVYGETRVYLSIESTEYRPRAPIDIDIVCSFTGNRHRERAPSASSTADNKYTALNVLCTRLIDVPCNLQ